MKGELTHFFNIRLEVLEATGMSQSEAIKVAKTEAEATETFRRWQALGRGRGLHLLRFKKQGKLEMARVSKLKGPGPGRPKGLPNHVTLELKGMIEKALSKAGGVQYLEEQAKANPGAFLTLVAKLLPRDLNISGSVGVDCQARLEAARRRLLSGIETTTSSPAPIIRLLESAEPNSQEGEEPPSVK